MIRTTCKTCGRVADWQERPKDTYCRWCGGKSEVSPVLPEMAQSNVR